MELASLMETTMSSPLYPSQWLLGWRGLDLLLVAIGQELEIKLRIITCTH